jgi:hypothetical protein
MLSSCRSHLEYDSSVLSLHSLSYSNCRISATNGPANRKSFFQN